MNEFKSIFKPMCNGDRIIEISMRMWWRLNSYFHLFHIFVFTIHIVKPYLPFSFYLQYQPDSLLLPARKGVKVVKEIRRKKKRLIQLIFLPTSFYFHYSSAPSPINRYHENLFGFPLYTHFVIPERKS